MKELKVLFGHIIFLIVYVYLVHLNINDPAKLFFGNVYGYDNIEIVFVLLMYTPIWIIEFYVFFQKIRVAPISLIRRTKLTTFWISIHISGIFRIALSYIFMWIAFSSVYGFNTFKMFWMNILFFLFIYEIGIAVWLIIGDYIVSVLISIVGVLFSNKLVVTYNVNPITNLFCWGTFNYFISDIKKGIYSIAFIVIIESIFIIFMIMMGYNKIFKKKIITRIFS